MISITSLLQAVMTDEVEDDLTWLRYWVVLATVSLVEMVVDPLVDYFPVYLLAKCVFLIWCMAPSPNNGASFVFTQVIQFMRFIIIGLTNKLLKHG